MRIDKLQVGYKETLLEISELNLEARKVYALVGANGRGKTTLMKTLIGQLQAISGSIKVENKDFAELSAIDKSKLFGFVQSRFSGVQYMKAKEFVALGRSPYTNAFGRLSERDEAIVKQSFNTMEITHLADKYTEELSDGERQLLAVAKVLAQETKYIFLDEPTAFLDYANKKRVLELLSKVAKEENKCVLYSSHDLEMTLEYSNGMIFVPSTTNHMKYSETTNISLKELVHVCFNQEV